MKADNLEFGSLLAYCPRPSSPEELDSRKMTHALKNDEYVSTKSGSILMSDWVAMTVSREKASLPFGDFFQSDSILAPVPKSSLMAPDTLWVPDRIAKALVREGIGQRVVMMLKRVKPLRKAASSLSKDRPTALEHFQSLGVIEMTTEPERIVLVDDVITRGATLLGAANRLWETYPETEIRAFAAVRTQSTSLLYKTDHGECRGIITLQDDGTTRRKP